MMIYPESLEVEIKVVRAYAPWQGGPILRKEQQEQARRASAARARKRHQRNLKSSVALEAKVLGGGGIEFPAAFAAVAVTPRTIAKLSQEYIAEIENQFRQLRGSTKCCMA